MSGLASGRYPASADQATHVRLPAWRPIITRYPKQVLTRSLVSTFRAAPAPST